MPITLNGTTGIVGPDGSAASPAIQGSDANTGMFFPAADTIAFAEGGTEVMRIDSSGNVGIGTSSPQATLDANGNIHARGASFPAFKFANSSGTALAEIYYGIGSADLNIVSNQSSGRVVFQTNGSERARIDSSGNLLINKTSTAASGSGYAFETNDTASFYRGGDGSAIRFFRSSSQVGRIDVTGTSTSYVTSSDYRLKENVQPMTGALAKVAQLKPCTYAWKIDGSEGEGFIAHELAEVCPHAVTGVKDAVNEDGSIKPQGIDTSFLVATLTAAIQELKAEVDALKAQLGAQA